MYRLAVLDAKEGVTSGLTAIFGTTITNQVLRTRDGTDTKSMDVYHLC